MRFSLLGWGAIAALLASSPPALGQTQPHGDAGESAAGDTMAGNEAPTTRGRGIHARVSPYIEAAQVALAELSPGSDVVTYSVVAAGIDAGFGGRNNQGSVSLRYERRFGWGNDTVDSDTISGVARASSAIIPRTLMIEAGALAARSRVENNGAAVPGAIDLGDSISQIYAVYAGPTLSTHTGDVALNGHYRIGYTRVESPDSVVLAPGQQPLDVFDDSVSHSAGLHAATRAGDLLPVGLGVGAGWNREDVSNLDQRVEDLHARADVTVPLSLELAVVGGIGWEKVEVSSRDALRDGLGQPIVGSDGRFVTDPNSPRFIAYDVEGLIWDAGVVWRPSRRTALEAHVGRRYGSTTWYGSFAYAPSSRSSFNLSVYDNVTGFGGQVNSALARLPTEFEAIRNPLNGDLGTCVSSLNPAQTVAGQGSCLGGVLGSVRSSVFRARGVMATYGMNLGRLQAGIGAGYDRRKFIAAPGTVLAAANGVVDENTWLAAYLNGELGENARFTTNYYANWFQSGDALAGDVTALGINAAYHRRLTRNISATAALGLDGVQREELPDIWSASALVGVRYSF